MCERMVAAPAVPSEPLKCLNCGGILRIVCDGPGNCPPPLGPKNQVRAGSMQARVYDSKPCRRCLRPFQPTGPNSRFCRQPDCKAPSISLAS